MSVKVKITRTELLLERKFLKGGEVMLGVGGSEGAVGVMLEVS